MMENQDELGMVGLGVMGRNLLLNLSDHGYPVAGYDTNTAQVALLNGVGTGRMLCGVNTLEALVQRLRVPRVVMLMVPAGDPVDRVIAELIPLLKHGDLIIDGGNSHFKETDRRMERLQEHGIDFLGVGISGGEEGARHGPSLMPGGTRVAYERVRILFEAIAAQVDDQPCTAYLGPGSAGHYVKMVHNGIEYGLMQLIAETYAIMKQVIALGDDELSRVYESWNDGKLNSYLLEITAAIFLKIDKPTGGRLVNLILDQAHQMGTGRWVSQDAMDLQVPVPTIDAAVAARHLSTLSQERQEAHRLLQRFDQPFSGNDQTLINQLESALYAGMILTYAQGMALLAAASVSRHYYLDLETIARIWRGGCIIRCSLLDEIMSAYHTRIDLPNLLADQALAKKVMVHQEDLRKVISTASDFGVSIPGFMASLAYLDGYRSTWLPANLIQAQRDDFGAHPYERTDQPGTFHTHWNP